MPMNMMRYEMKRAESSFHLEYPGTKIEVLFTGKRKLGHLVWVILKAEPAVRTWVPQAYLEDDSRKLE